jgi:exodeoxyribonuclease VIII
VQEGIFPGVQRAVYESWDAANQSTLKRFKKSAAHAKAEIDHPRAQTPGMLEGELCHLAALEPDKLELLYQPAPTNPDTGLQWDRRTKQGKVEWAHAEEKGQTVVPLKAWNLARAVRDALWAHPLAKEILSGKGVNEVGMVWECPENRVFCKSLVDRYTAFDGGPCLVDLKTTVDASPEGFPREIAKYDYHVQAAFYLWGARLLSPAERRFLFIAVEKEPPYGITVHELEESALIQGKEEFRVWLKRWAQARETGVWEGYPHGVFRSVLPAWRYREIEEDE